MFSDLLLLSGEILIVNAGLILAYHGYKYYKQDPMNGAIGLSLGLGASMIAGSYILKKL